MVGRPEEGGERTRAQHIHSIYIHERKTGHMSSRHIVRHARKGQRACRKGQRGKNACSVCVRCKRRHHEHPLIDGAERQEDNRNARSPPPPQRVCVRAKRAQSARAAPKCARCFCALRKVFERGDMRVRGKRRGECFLFIERDIEAMLVKENPTVRATQNAQKKRVLAVACTCAYNNCVRACSTTTRA